MRNKLGSLVTTLNPTFEGEYARRFDSLCRDLAQIADQNQSSREIRFKEEFDWLNGRSLNLLAAQRYWTGLLILADLLSLSWEIHYSPAGLELISPAPKKPASASSEAVQTIKSEVRNDLAESVRKQHQHPATQDFIKRLEQPHDRSKHEHPISALIADGQELAARLEAALGASKDEYETALAEAIQPYLQLVEYEERDQFTGIKLGEIWRYFRLTWSIPSTSVPGRQVLYLIRDAAHPYHAVIGIAALSNSAMQVKDRDDYIGWTLQEYRERLQEAVGYKGKNEANHLMSLLEGFVEAGLEDVDWHGLATQEEIDCPNEGAINRLRTEVGRYALERKKELRELEDTDELSASMSDFMSEMADGEIETLSPQVSDEILALDTHADEKGMNQSRRLLVFKKRAFELSRLLHARLVFQKIRQSSNLLDALSKSLHREEFESAVNSALFANKKIRIGINMLEITTCGAIEPYNHILGGKLVALLLVSPQVVADYRARYGDKPSLITSQLRNEEVIRPCDLVYLGTTSLYSVGSSQYNRLSLPAQIFHPEQPEIRYVPVGQTSGFGTVQFSNVTSRAITDLEMAETGYQDVNSIFGEGFSPKLRKVRAGLNNLGYDSEVMLRHNQPRLLYAVELTYNAREFLRGESHTLPEYILNPQDPKNATEKIAEFWRVRWLSRRIERPEIRERVRAFKSASLLTANGQLQNETEDVLPAASSEVRMPSAQEPLAPNPNTSVSVEFVQKLYRDTSAYSDRMDDLQREAININTPLENFVLDKLSKGFSIILTGNAGDGKTHILTRLHEQIEKIGAYVIPDASIIDSPNVLEIWQAAIDNNRPFCMAANEWPLYVLIRKYEDSFPILKDVRQQLDKQLVYQADEVIPDIQSSRLVVIDLGNRNNLQEDFFQAALEAVLRDDLYEQCPRCALYRQCDATHNRQLLSKQQVVERLSLLVKRLAALGHHITIRELLSMLSYMVFGGRTCTTLFKDSGRHRTGLYADQLFSPEAEGKIFDLLRAHVDPAMISDPHWDVKLYYNDYQADDWIEPNTVEPIRSDKTISLPQQSSVFNHVKRRFYFEHRDGDQILNMLPEDEQEFYRLIDPHEDYEDILDSILVAINLFFCPVLKKKEATENLFVWTAHRYDERVPKAFLCKQVINRRLDLQIRRPMLSPNLNGAFTYYPDHVRLVAYPGRSYERWLDIDFALFKTMQSVERGLPPMLVPEEQVVRLFQFMNALQAVNPNHDADRQEIRSYIVGHKHILSTTVKRSTNEIIRFSDQV